MPRHIWSVLAVATVLGSASSVWAQAPSRPVYQQASLVVSSTLQGSVRDEQGRPLVGAMVSALAVTNSVSKVSVSDAKGRFALSLPAGSYVLRANRDGYSSCRDQILIPASQALEHNITMVRQPAPGDRPVMVAAAGGATAAGASRQPSGSTAAKTDTSADDHTHDDLAWRLRQITRTALRDIGPIDVPDSQPRSFKPRGSSVLDWAFLNSARAATSFLTTTPFTGQLNLLTSSTLSASPGLAPLMPRGIASGTVGAPVGVSGDWTMRAAMNSGDWSSWAVLGEYQARQSRQHAFRIGLSYTVQSFAGTDPASLSTAPGSSHSAGGMYMFDHWRVGPRLQLDYGLRLDRFDYVRHGDLLSPRAGARVGVLPSTFVVMSASQRMVAPGAEEFLPPTTGPWLPPERTFEPLGSATFVAERVRHDELGLEHDFGGRTLGVRYFRESAINQLVNVFGGDSAAVFAPAPGHFGVATAGNVDVDGWDVRADGALTGRIHGRIDYIAAQPHWLPCGDAALLVLLAPSTVRGSVGRVHDLTASLEASIPETGTRVAVVYQLDSAFSQSSSVQTRPALGSRFDLQINQGLPFRPIGGSRMELLLAVRNQFRDLREPGSMFDELLTVAPPLRVIGGLQIRF